MSFRGHPSSISVIGPGSTPACRVRRLVTQRYDVDGLLRAAATMPGPAEPVSTVPVDTALVPHPWRPTHGEDEVREVTRGRMPRCPDAAAYQPWSPVAQEAWPDAITTRILASLSPTGLLAKPRGVVPWKLHLAGHGRLGTNCATLQSCEIEPMTHAPG